MKYICLDLRNKMTIAKVHEVLKVMLELPDYYGNNYNALYDELTSIQEKVEIEVIVKEANLKRWETLRRVLADAANDNRRIVLRGKVL
jgi:Barstar, RNAse (barnase) inhibitor